MVPHSVSGCMWSLSFSLSREGGILGKRLAHAGSGAAPLGSPRLQGQACCRVSQEAVGCYCADEPGLGALVRPGLPQSEAPWLLCPVVLPPASLHRLLSGLAWWVGS